LSVPSLEDFGDMYSEVNGGRFFPEHCIPRQRVAIIVPFRNRTNQLKTFLLNIHPFLKRQLIDYTIFIVEEVPNIKWNKGKLMNTGFQEALSQDHGFQCFIFHDVDLLPEDDRIL